MKKIYLCSLIVFFTLFIVACDSNTDSTPPVTDNNANTTQTPPQAVVEKTDANAGQAVAASDAPSYSIDTEGAHAFINAKFKHLGYSVLWATFKKFDGTFQYDAENIANSRVNVTVDVASIDSNHTKRDEHMRGADYLDTATYPTATFNSTSIRDVGNGRIYVSGDLTLHGVTKAITFEANVIGEGDDPWGGYRVGLQGKYTLAPAQFGMTKFRPGSVDLELYIEGIKQK